MMTHHQLNGNAAGNLAHLLGRFVKGIGDGKNRKVLDRWCEVLGIEEHTLPELLPVYSAIVGLPGRARDDLRSLPSHAPKDDIAEGLARVERLFSQVSLQTPHSQQYVKVLVNDSGTLRDLRSLASWTTHLFGSQPHEPGEELESVDEYRRALEGLWQDVVADEELDDDVRQFLIRRLTGLIHALRLYQVDGGHAMRDEQDRFQGEMARSPDVTARAKATKYWDGFTKALNNLAAAVVIFQGVVGGHPAELPAPAPAIEAEHPDSPAASESSHEGAVGRTEEDGDDVD